MNPSQQLANQAAVTRDRQKIEELGGPIPCPDKPTPAIWEIYKTTDGT